MGPDYVAYEVLDRTVDSLFPHLSEVEETQENFKNRMVMAPPEQMPGMLRDLFSLKRQTLAIRKIAGPSATYAP